MSREFKIKQNDTSPALTFTLFPSSVVLTGADVVFNMRDQRGTIIVDRAASTVVTATGTPTVRHIWDASHTKTAGVFQGEFEVTYSDNTVETFPNDGFISIKIVDDIA